MENYTFCSLKEKVFAIKVESKKTNQPTKTHTKRKREKNPKMLSTNSNFIYISWKVTSDKQFDPVKI